MKRLVFAMTLALACCGCKTGIDSIVDTFLSENSCSSCCVDRTNSVESANRVAVICSLTKVDPKKYGGWDGDCPGTDVDSGIFAAMCDQYGIPYTKLENEQANSENVLSKSVAACDSLGPSGGLLILYFSGHGGQVTSSSKDEEDGLDETICLWDGQLRDKHIWSLLTRVPKNVRVWMVTDCCNSGTNYRKPRDFAKSIRKMARERGELRLARGLVRRATDEEPHLLHWGGCGDGESSYGSESGGQFTAALVDTFSTRKTYREWFNDAVKRMPKYQSPTCGETGVSFQDTLIFR